MKHLSGRIFKIYFFVFVFLIITGNIHAQNNRFELIYSKLDQLSQTVKNLNDTINISVDKIELQEFVRAISIANNVNISIDPDINYTIVNNFTNVRFKDVLYFLIKEYNLDIGIIGNIISITKYVEPAAPKPIPKTKELKITFSDEKLRMDLSNDTIYNVVKKITQLTGKNIVLQNEIKNTVVSAYIQDMPVDAAVRKLAMVNGLVVDKSNDGFLIIDKAERLTTKGTEGTKKSRSIDDIEDYLFELTVEQDNLLSIKATNVPVDTIIRTAIKQLNLKYHFLSELSGSETFYVNNISFDELLDLLTNDKDFSYKKVQGIYLIGNKKINHLTQTKLVPLNYRTIEGLKSLFPASVIDGLEIIDFIELNSFLVSGPEVKVKEFENFIYEIDKLVPVVLIEIIIIDYQKWNNKEVGIDMGISDNVTSKVNLLPSVDMTFTSKSVNKLLSTLNGWGWFNLGKVNESFYISLKALEDNGIIEINQTPRISTLNGHKATLTSGETRYYYEENSSVISTQSIYEKNTRTYKSVNADLSISVQPIVSGDKQITMQIEVSQSDFKDPIAEGAPPGSVNRNFSSYIRVKDQEMVLLGGLERTAKSDTGTGVPLLSRIPVIKWLFSSRSKNKSESKLNFFIKPTVIY